MPSPRVNRNDCGATTGTPFYHLHYPMQWASPS